jgi:hypothetical protein
VVLIRVVIVRESTVRLYESYLSRQWGHAIFGSPDDFLALDGCIAARCRGINGGLLLLLYVLAPQETTAIGYITCVLIDVSS